MRPPIPFLKDQIYFKKRVFIQKKTRLIPSICINPEPDPDPDREPTYWRKNRCDPDRRQKVNPAAGL
jgi:hypothetical protein